MLVGGVAEGDDGVGEVLAAGKVLEAELLVERVDGVGGFAFAVGAGDDDGVTFDDERLGRISLERNKRRDVAFCLEIFGYLPSQPLGSAGLRRVENGDLKQGWRLDAWTGGGGGVEAGKEAVEPVALLWRERGIVGNEGNQVVGMVLSPPAGVQNALSSAMLCRRLNSRKDSSACRDAAVYAAKRRSITGGKVGELDGGDEFAGEALVLVRATADDNLVALFATDFDAHETDVADVVLRAGMRTTSDMQVDGLLNFEMAVEVIGESDGVGLGVAGGVSTAFVSGAGYGSVEDRAGVEVEARSEDGLLCRFEVGAGDVGDDEALPDGEAQITAAETVRNVGERERLRNRQLAHRNRNADVVKVRLRLRMDADVGRAIDGVARFACIDGNANEREGEALLGLGEELLHAPTVDEIFEASLLTIGPISVLGEDTNHCGRHCNGLVRAKENAAVGGELFVSGDAAKKDPEVDAGGNALTFFDLARRRSRCRWYRQQR